MCESYHAPFSSYVENLAWLVMSVSIYSELKDEGLSSVTEESPSFLLITLSLLCTTYAPYAQLAYRCVLYIILVREAYTL
ncbi:hypothetical protein A2673_02090 [Candidatus Kaiserbacteria bacterium RIFCSPHIGHO2_01_FULL_50_13]|nr:MAG: hypothetical protein A2673_02090 [Candidatus Kaiserbacteria bacterium RIFCSPHIGHO2_01_FULL_50_13]